MTETKDEVRHWADVAAAEIVAAGRAAVISTGISPSGEIHIGNMREVVTADAVFRALKDAGAPARFNYIADNFDPLRKVYPFLDAATYQPLIGRPLSEIPCPCGGHTSYSEHYLAPFLGALDRLRIDVEVERADQMYKSGRMTPYIVQALEQRDRIAAILEELTGKRCADDWSPFNPLCPACGRIQSARVVDFSVLDETIDYSCECGSSGSVPMAGGGKLVWRVDWPARWMMLGVTVEPFGKDHATRGGSYDTGKRIVSEVFKGQAPHPIPYEWIRLKGQGDMSSSLGNVLSIHRILEVVPPEVLRYMVIRERPQRRITFSPAVPLLQLVDEVDDAASTRRNARALELSTAGGFRPVGIPFKHLVVVAQVASYDADRTVQILERTGYSGVDRDAVADRLVYARSWLEAFAPEDMRFTVATELPAPAGGLGDAQRAFLLALADGLEVGMDGDAVHDLIYGLAGGFAQIKPAKLFEAIYLALLGKARGPRAGWFVSLLGAEFCAARFREAHRGLP